MREKAKRISHTFFPPSYHATMTRTAPLPSKAQPKQAGRRSTAADEFLQQKIEEAQNSLWWAEFTRASLQSVLILIAAVGLWVLMDQWLFSPGNAARWMSLGIIAFGMAFFLIRRVLPLFRQSVGPEYAARSLEQNFPELRHALTSYVTLRSSDPNKETVSSNGTVSSGGAPQTIKPPQTRGTLQNRVIQSIGSSTASYLQQHDELPVEATRTIRWWVAMILATVAFLIYAALSPKNPLPSMTRLAAPWASIDSAKRVTITEVLPGDTSVTSGDHVTISARIRGLKRDDVIQCQWSDTPWAKDSSDDSDHHAITFSLLPDHALLPNRVLHGSGSPIRGSSENGSMEHSGSTDRFAGNMSIPDDAQGKLFYRIVAGDAVSGPYRLDVKNVPVVAVESVKYEPPGYTREAAYTRTSGAISGVEGTRVTILARTNRHMVRAAIEFNPKPIGKRIQPTAGAVEMQLDHESRTLSVTISLRLPRENAGSVIRDSYRIRVWDEEGATNPHPIVYPIETIADLAPEVAIMLPANVPKDVPFNAQQIIAVHASDADYGLAQIRLQMRMGIQQLPDVVLWRNRTGETGNQIAEYRFRPNRLLLANGDFLRPGQTVKVTAVAIDNRRSPLRAGQTDRPIAEESSLETWIRAGANVTVTDAIELRITKPDELPPPNQPDDQGMSGQDQRPATDPNAGEQQGGGNQNQSGGSAPESDSNDAKQGNSGQGGSQSGGASSQSQESSGDGQESGDGGGSGASENPNPNENSSGDSSPNESSPSGGKASNPNQGMSDSNPDNSGSANSNSGNTPPNAGESAKPGQSDAPPAEATGSESSNADQASESSNSSTGESGDSANTSTDPNSTDPNSRDAGSQQDPTQRGAKQPSNAQPSQGGSSQGGSSQPQGPSDDAQGKPHHDAEAFERIKKFIEKMKQNQQGGEQNGSQQQGQPNPTEQAEQNGSENPSDSKSQPGNPNRSGDPHGSRQTNPNSMPDDSKKHEADSNAPKQGSESETDGEGANDANDQNDQDNRKGNKGQSGDENPLEAPSNGDLGKDSKTDPTMDPQGSSQNQSSQDPPAGHPSPTGDSQDEQGGQSATDPATAKPPGDSGKQPADPSQSSEPSGGSASESTNPSNPPGSSNQPGAPRSGNPQPATDPSSPNSSQPRPSESGNQPGTSGTMAGSSDNARSGDGRESHSTPVDEVNTDYAKRATEMVLDYLDETREQPDPDLLKELDWNPQDLERFRKHWNRVRDLDPGELADPQREKEQREMLRSLGLRPPSSSGQSKIKDKADSLGPIRDTGNRLRPPAAHRDAFDAFRRALSGKKK